MDMNQRKHTKAATTPIYQTSSFTLMIRKHGADLFDLKVEGNIYTRIMNPTNAVLEQRVAEMEGGIASLACFWNGCYYLCYSVHYKSRG